MEVKDLLVKLENLQGQHQAAAQEMVQLNTRKNKLEGAMELLEILIEEFNQEQTDEPKGSKKKK